MTATRNEMFPVLVGYGSITYPDAPKSVPWELLLPHNETAKSNHGGQTLERLAERGGLSPDEMMAIINDTPYQKYWSGLSREQVRFESVKRLNELLGTNSSQQNQCLSA